MNALSEKVDCEVSIWNRQIKWKLNLSRRIDYRSARPGADRPDRDLSRFEVASLGAARNLLKATKGEQRKQLDGNRSNTKNVFKKGVFIERLSSPEIRVEVNVSSRS